MRFDGRWFGPSILMLILVSVEVGAVNWLEPEPFRRDRLEGRQFDYNAESFLHRFSFEPKPALSEQRVLRGNGIEGVAGSSRSRELYVRSEVRLELPLDGPGFAGYRFRRHEDFDGRFDENLVGGGLRYGGWQAGVWGDVVGAKEDIDIHGDVQWSDDRGNRFRATVVAVDAVFNSKQNDGVYERYPYTYYLGGRWQITPQLAVYGFGNVNTPMELQLDSINLRAEDEQYSGGLGVDVAVTESVSAGLRVEGLYGLREQRGLDGPVQEEQRLRRSYGAVTAEMRQSLDQGEQRWFGVRYLQLTENDRRPRDPMETMEMERREYTVYAGRRWHLRESIAFAPGVFLAYHDNTEVFPGDEDSDDSDRGFYGKLAPAVEFTVNQRTGGRIALNPTLRLHRAAFGGGNVQVYLPF